SSHALPPPHSTLFPYTTLFRSISRRGRGAAGVPQAVQGPARACNIGRLAARRHQAEGADNGGGQKETAAARTQTHGLRLRWRGRSEEHTSELQSRENLVCRLLL